LLSAIACIVKTSAALCAFAVNKLLSSWRETKPKYRQDERHEPEQQSYSQFLQQAIVIVLLWLSASLKN
jgi:hypothetical protein